MLRPIRFRFLLCVWILNWGIGAQAQLPISIESNEGGTVEFSISVQALGTGEYYQVLWIFDDGTYDQDTLFLEGEAPPIETAHIYHGPPNGSADYQVRAELTKVYTPPDEEEVLLYAQSPIFPTDITTNNPESPDLYGKGIRADRSRDPREGAGMTLMLTYLVSNNDTCNLETEGATVEVHYGGGLVLDPVYFPGTGIEHEIEVYHQEPNGYTNDRAGIGIKKPASAEIGSKRDVYLNFFTPEDYLSDPSASAETFVSVQVIDSMGRVCTDLMTEPLRILKKGEPYDPNKKWVDVDTTSTNPEQWFTYTIRCQNDGDAPTDTIRIIDTLDYRLNPSTLEVLKVEAGFEQIVNPMDEAMSVASFDYPGEEFSFHYYIEQNGQIVTWTLIDDGKLRGTDEEGLGSTFVLMETIARIKFRVQTYCLEETNLVIPNQASIYFNTQPPIQTEPALTHKLCCQEATTFDSVVFDLTPYVDTLQLPGPYSSFQVVSLSTDSFDPANPTNPNPEAFIFGSTAEYNASSLGSPSYTGVDILQFVVCDTASVPNCDTFSVAICANLSPTAYPCDTTTCLYSVGIEEELEESMAPFTIGPNPFSHSLTLYPQQPEYPIRQVAMYNLQGVLVLSYEEEHFQPLNLNTSHLPPGVYLIRVNEREIFKVVKK